MRVDNARAAAKLVKAANRYHSRVTISTGQLCVDAKSILGVLTLAAGKDTPVILEVEGPDEVGAAEALASLIGSGFGGSVSALRLAEKGYSVLVLEAGRRWESTDFPSTTWNLRRFLWFPRLGMRGIQRMARRG